MTTTLAQRRIGSPEFHLQKIESFLAQKLAKEARPRCTEVALCHHVQLPDGNEDAQIIDRVKVTADSSTEQIAEQIYATAKASVEAHSRPQRYGCVALENPETVIGRHAFLLTPPPSSSFGTGETEPATNAGVLAQQMRHYEACMRLMIMSQQHASGVLETELERVRAENERLRTTHFAMIQAREELLDRSADRAMRIRQEQAEVARGERWVSRAEQLLSGILETHLKLPAGAATPTAGALPSGPGASDVQRWLSTLSEEQRSKLTGSLSEILTEEQAQSFYDTITGGAKA